MPVLKQLVEVLFSAGLMQVVFATDTLALGVNMPARSVVIGRMTKWDGRRRRVLIPNEFQQMAGRAGRRGMDVYGHVVVPYSPWIAFREMLEIATGPWNRSARVRGPLQHRAQSLGPAARRARARRCSNRVWRSSRRSQRIRQLEDDIIEIGGDIAGVPKGCLIGLDAGDELLEDYRNVNGTLTTAQQKERRSRRSCAEVQRAAILRRPGRNRSASVRRAFRYALDRVDRPSPRAWLGCLRRQGRGGVGLFLFGGSNPSCQRVPPDRLPDRRQDRPGSGRLIEPPDEATDATELVSGEGARQPLATGRAVGIA